MDELLPRDVNYRIIDPSVRRTLSKSEYDRSKYDWYSKIISSITWDEIDRYINKNKEEGLHGNIIVYKFYFDKGNFYFGAFHFMSYIGFWSKYSENENEYDSSEVFDTIYYKDDTYDQVFILQDGETLFLSDMKQRYSKFFSLDLYTLSNILKLRNIEIDILKDILKFEFNRKKQILNNYPIAKYIYVLNYKLEDYVNEIGEETIFNSKDSRVEILRDFELEHFSYLDINNYIPNYSQKLLDASNKILEDINNITY